MNEQTGRKSGLTAILLLIIVAGLALAIYQSLALSSTTRAIADARQSKRETADEIAKNARFKQQYESTVKQLGARMPQCTWSEQLSPMVARLARIVDERQQVKIETLQPEPPVITEQIARFPLRISFGCNLTELAKILRDLRIARPLLKVEQLDIRNDQAKEGSLRVEMTIASFVVLEKETTSGRAVPATKKQDGTTTSRGGKP